MCQKLREGKYKVNPYQCFIWRNWVGGENRMCTPTYPGHTHVYLSLCLAQLHVEWTLLVFQSYRNFRLMKMNTLVSEACGHSKQQ